MGLVGRRYRLKAWSGGEEMDDLLSYMLVQKPKLRKSETARLKVRILFWLRGGCYVGALNRVWACSIGTSTWKNRREGVG